MLTGRVDRGFRKLAGGMDCRVKPGNDEDK